MSVEHNKHKNKRWLRWGRDLLLVFMVVYLVQLWQTRDAPSGPAPELSGRMLGGGELNLKQLAGKPVLVHFWATWCPICRTEDGSIHNLAEDYQVLTVASNSGNAEEIQQYLDENQVSFPVMLDESGIMGNRWGVRGVPSSYVVDGSGEIRSIAVGYTTEIGLRIRLWLGAYPRIEDLLRKAHFGQISP